MVEHMLTQGVVICHSSEREAKSNSSHFNICAASFGDRLFTGQRQAIPSRSIDSCAADRATLPSTACGQMQRPRSSRRANKQSPSPSNHSGFTKSPRRPRRKKVWPEKGFSASVVSTSAAAPCPRLFLMSVTPAANHHRGIPLMRSPLAHDLTDRSQQFGRDTPLATIRPARQSQGRRRNGNEATAGTPWLALAAVVLPHSRGLSPTTASWVRLRRQLFRADTAAAICTANWYCSGALRRSLSPKRPQPGYGKPAVA